MKTPNNQMDKDLANKLFYYADGKLYWKKISYPMKSNGEAGVVRPDGYVKIKYKQKPYYAHNIIWNMINGIVSNGYTIDHIDRNPNNNNLDNLRLATPTLQMRNRTPNKTSKSGISGLVWSKEAMKWIGTVIVAKKRHRIGTFNCPVIANIELTKAHKLLWA